MDAKLFFLKLVAISMKVIPLLLVVTFCIGIFFNLWKVQELSPILSAVIAVVGAVVIGWGFGKLIKLW